MTERDLLQRMRRGAQLDGQGGAGRGGAEGDGAARSGPPRREPVLFWAEREPAFYLRATAISALLMLPVAFFLPALFLFFLVFLGLSGWLNARLFLFEIGPQTLALRQSLLSPRMHIPLSDIVGVQTREDASGRILGGSAGAGVLLMTLKGGRILPVPGLKEVGEVAAAIKEIQSGQGRPPPPPHGGGDIGPGAVAAG